MMTQAQTQSGTTHLYPYLSPTENNIFTKQNDHLSCGKHELLLHINITGDSWVKTMYVHGGLFCDFAKTSVILPQITGELLNSKISFFNLFQHVVSSLFFLRNEIIRELPKSPKSFASCHFIFLQKDNA